MLLKNLDLGVDKIISEMKRGLESKGFVNGIINKLLPITQLTEAEQIRPVRNNSAAPINQPRQQRQNVQQLPMQRIERGNGNRERGNSRDNRRNN